MKIIKRRTTITEAMLVLARPGDPELVKLLTDDASNWILDLRFPGGDKYRLKRTYKQNECRWHSDGADCWETECDHNFYFTEGGPLENGFKFCPYCGHKIAREQST